MTIRGTRHNDNLTGTTGDDIFAMSRGGDDTVHGLKGHDVFRFGSTFTAADSILGGGGSDRLSLNGDYTGANAVTFGAQTMTGVENIWLTGGHSYDLTTDDATVAAGRGLHINGKGLGGADTLTFDGSAETDGNFLFKFGGNFTTADHLTGGAGDDTLFLNGDYLPFVFAVGQLASIETLKLGAGHDYNFAWAGGNLTAGQTLTVDATALQLTDGFTFNGSSEALGNLHFRIASQGTIVSGGQNNDIFEIDADAGRNVLSTANLIGGSGNDTLLVNGANYSGFSLTQISSVETIVVADGHSYGFSIDGTHMPSGTLTIDGSVLTGSNVLNFDGSSVTSGGFDFIGGAGDDSMALGGSTILAASTVDGGLGNDTLFISGNDYSLPTPIAITGSEIHSVETIKLGNGFNYNLEPADDAVAAGTTLTIDGSSLDASSVMVVRGGNETDGNFILSGGQADDELIGGAGSDTFDLQFGGNDTATGGSGGDTFVMGSAFTAGDFIDGGTGANILTFQGTYASLAIDDANVHNIQTLSFADGFGGNTYDATLTGDISGGQTVHVATNFLDSSNSSSLTFDASGSSDAILFVSGGLFGTFHITGSAQDDTFEYGFDLGSNIDASSFDGGAGNDTLIVDAQLAGTMTLSGVTNVETLVLTDASYDITIADSVTAAGATLTVDATQLRDDRALTFDGSAETDGNFDITVGGSNGSIVLGAVGSSVTLTGNGYSVTAGAVTESGDDTFAFNGTGETLVDGGEIFHAIVTGFDHATDGDLIHLAAADFVASTVLVDSNADTLITLNDGSTILLKGVTDVDAGFFG